MVLQLRGSVACSFRSRIELCRDSAQIDCLSIPIGRSGPTSLTRGSGVLLSEEGGTLELGGLLWSAMEPNKKRKTAKRLFGHRKWTGNEWERNTRQKGVTDLEKGDYMEEKSEKRRWKKRAVED
uniref:Uncharacterized protein n=1 Tax=Oryza sativa subsp. japonica TaxID=39947 RepID=Q67W48_ORYSJ|nr:hypothetical protein [Oryza sativa Japonica Group]